MFAQVPFLRIHTDCQYQLNLLHRPEYAFAPVACAFPTRRQVTAVRGVVRSTIEELRWIVPRRAISSDRLMMIEQGKVRSRSAGVDFNVQGAFPVLGLPDQHWAVLREALSPGTLVVVDGSRALTEGAVAEPIFSGETMIGGGAREPDTAASPGIDLRRAESSESP
jgi:hypothetical protein